MALSHEVDSFGWFILQFDVLQCGAFSGSKYYIHSHKESHGTGQAIKAVCYTRFAWLRITTSGYDCNGFIRVSSVLWHSCDPLHRTLLETDKVKSMTIVLLLADFLLDSEKRRPHTLEGDGVFRCMMFVMYQCLSRLPIKVSVYNMLRPVLQPAGPS